MIILPKETGYKKLFVYKKSKELVLIIYHLTNKYPRSEIYSIVPQMRRCAISILANIVEGYAKESSKEFARFLTIAIGSLFELEVFLDLSLNLKYIKEKEFNNTTNLLNDVKKLLYGTRKVVRLR